MPAGSQSPALSFGRLSDRDLHGRPLPGFAVDIDTGLPSLNKPRLAVVRFSKWSRVESEQQKVFEAAIAELRSAGAVLEELELSELDDANWTTINCILSSEAALIFADLIANYPERTSDHLKSLVENGKAHSATSYLAARAFQDVIAANPKSPAADEAAAHLQEIRK